MSQRKKAPGKKASSTPAETPAAAAEEGSGGNPEEGGNETRTVEVQGLVFELPAEVPFGAMLASRKLLNAATDENAGATELAYIDILEAYIGPEQLKMLERKKLSLAEGTKAVRELLDKIKEEYGVGEGESSASSES